MADVTVHYPEPLVDGNYHVPEDEAGHFVATLNCAFRFAAGDRVSAVHVWLSRRTPQKKNPMNGAVYDEGGWLEHIVRVEWKTSGGMTIGAIQRNPGAESEFHS